MFLWRHPHPGALALGEHLFQVKDLPRVSSLSPESVPASLPESAIPGALAEWHPKSAQILRLGVTNHLLPSPDVHRLHPGVGEPVPGAAPLHHGAGAAVLQAPCGRAAAAYLCHCQQLLLQHEEEQEGPVLHYQVRFWVGHPPFLSIL